MKRHMKVLMYGWEFPPQISGGLGVACFGIVKGLTEKGVKVSLVLPQPVINKELNENASLLDCSRVNIQLSELIKRFGDHFDVHAIDSLLHPYMTEHDYLLAHRTTESLDSKNSSSEATVNVSGGYGPNLFSEVHRYALAAGSKAAQIDHDVIHAHDWLTVLAGVEAKRLSNKPLIFQVHALEPDRSGLHLNQRVYDIERYGMEQADHIIAVSEYTKNMMINRYSIPASKISVVHNGITSSKRSIPCKENDPNRRKLVLFVGRVTQQKGPWYFIEIAKKILEKRVDVEFVIAGTGDLLPSMIEHTAASRVGKQIHFTGFLKPDQVKKLYQLADIYVMPSVSEPFGLTPLEALSLQVPALISKQSGVAEVLPNVLKADFWDIDDMATKILAVLDYKALKPQMLESSKSDVLKLTWSDAAQKMIHVYDDMVEEA